MPDTFSGKIQFRADFGQGLRFAIAEAEPSLDDEPFFLVQLRKQFLKLLLEGLRDENFVHRGNTRVTDQVFQMHLVLVSDWSAKRNLGWSSFHHAADIFFLHTEFLRNLVDAGPPAELLCQARYFGFETVEFMFQFWGEAEHLAMVSDRRQNGLANPPACVGDESHVTRRVETRGRFDQTHVAFIDQFVERIAGPGVFLGHRDNKAKIGFN